MGDTPALCFTDTDCLFKLAAAGLWDEALRVLGIPPSDVRITTEPGDKLQAQRPKFERSLRLPDIGKLRPLFRD